MIDYCVNLKGYLDYEIDIIKTSLGSKINEQSELEKFIENNAEKIRSEYCGKICAKRYECILAIKYWR